MKRSTAVAINCVPERTGFWLQISTTRRVKYRLRYFVLGAGGHQREGQLQGTAGSRYHRRFVELRISVIVVGVTDLVLSFGKGSLPEGGGPYFPTHFGTSKFLPGPKMASEGHIEISAAARRRRKESAEGPYGGAYGMYGLYGTYLYRGGGELTLQPAKTGRPKKTRRPKKRKSSKRK